MGAFKRMERQEILRGHANELCNTVMLKKKKKQQMHFLKPKQETQSPLALFALCNPLKTVVSVSNANVL